MPVAPQHFLAERKRAITSGLAGSHAPILSQQEAVVQDDYRPRHAAAWAVAGRRGCSASLPTANLRLIGAAQNNNHMEYDRRGCCDAVRRVR